MNNKESNNDNITIVIEGKERIGMSTMAMLMGFYLK